MSDKKQMRPIARGLKIPALPKFVQQSMIMIRDPKAAVAFKTNVISFHSQHKIRICHYEKGPSMFYVHLESRDSEYKQFSSRLQSTELRNTRPSIGMACLVRHNNKIYRATVAKFFQNPSQDLIVNLVDLGYSASVKLENIFHISEEFSTPFTFALPFSLYGINSGEIKVSDTFTGFYFRQLTNDRSLTLKCVPSDGKLKIS